MENVLKIEADSKGVWISSESDDFTLASVVNFLSSKGVRKYDEKAVVEFAREKRRIPQKIADRDILEERHSIIHVSSSKDDMTAFISVEPPFFTNHWPDKADMLEALGRKNVVFGVDEKIIENLAELKLAYESVAVAEGKPPVNGHEARIEFLLDPDRPPEAEHDSEKIDHRERSAFVYVKQGENVAVKHPLTEGEDA